MSLTPEWRQRINSWRNELPRHVYRALAPLSFEGFVTSEQLGMNEALAMAFSPMPHGTTWGAKWEYGWFRTQLVLPDEANDRRVVLRIDVGGESAVHVDGVAAGAVDRHHATITLASRGSAGTRHHVVVEAYAGHGPRVSSVGPVPPGRASVPEPAPEQTVVGQSSYGIWEEDVYQLWLDVESLYQVRDNMDPNSLRVAEIDRGLRDMTLMVDFEQPRHQMLETVRTCRERLRPLLDCVNGSTAPTLYAFGHSHIDVAWLWPLAETERKCRRTFATQLALIDEYPEYRFLQSQAHLYWMAKNLYPSLYERITEAIKSGRWLVEGGMWVEADTNLSGGESLIRQFLHGKRFFSDEFGVVCELLWLPDVFGYSGNLPQIMAGCGIKYFSTAKIFWAYGGGDPFPYNTFTWEGIDGSEVLVHLCNNYNSEADPSSLIERWDARVQKDGISSRLVPFGWGDGGGGPTRDHLEYLRRARDLEGVPRVRMAHPCEYFHDLEAQGPPDARYVGELYFQAHRGTYTSQAKTKRGNRKSEIALREAEMWTVAAMASRDYTPRRDALRSLWQDVLLNQFHDIIPGSSIARVYEEAEETYAHVLATATKVAREAATALAEQGDALSVFNSLSWERDGVTPLPMGYSGARTLAGKSAQTQEIDGQTWAQVTVPSCGWTTLRLDRGSTPLGTGASDLRASAELLENAHLLLSLDAQGEVVSLYDKDAGRELAAGPCNSLRMYRDVPSRFDAWDIDSMYTQTAVALDEPAHIEVVAEGSLVARVHVTRRLHESTMIQEISLRRGSRRVDFCTEIDWQECHKVTTQAATGK